jgi:hypothetical protein
MYVPQRPPRRRVTTAGSSPPDSVCRGEHDEQRLAVGSRSARATMATTPSPSGRLRGRWHGPCPDSERGDGGHPRRLSETNGIHGTGGYRARTDAEHATPLTGPTYRARPRYRLAGPRSAGETLIGTRDRPAVPRWSPRASARGGSRSVLPDRRVSLAANCLRIDRTERRSPVENSSRRRLVSSAPRARGSPERCRSGVGHPR